MLWIEELAAIAALTLFSATLILWALIINGSI
jgi:hypothetical protein